MWRARRTETDSERDTCVQPRPRSVCMCSCTNRMDFEVPAHMSWRERIVIDPQILVGKPVVRGTRLSVELIVDLLGQGWSEADILRSYPNLTAEDNHACLKYASAVMRSEKVYPVAPR
jgi:uncharacterized protein (DUF433 family)